MEQSDSQGEPRAPGGARGSGAFAVEPYSEGCRRIYEEGEHVVVGVSPGNSYFGVELLTGLLRWLGGQFRRADVVVPDTAVVHTYLALGYPPQKARKKAHAETNVLRNRVVRAWQAAGGPRPGDGVHMMSELAAGPAYRRLHAAAEAALEADGELRTACLETSRAVLRSRLGGASPTAEQVAGGVRYVIAELPFFVGSAEIFGAPSSLCFYHQPIPLAGALFSRTSALVPSARQGYATIRPAARPVPRPAGPPPVSRTVLPLPMAFQAPPVATARPAAAHPAGGPR
jgi:cyclo(L-tyrosyl-L-tyrosyl) synthase